MEKNIALMRKLMYAIYSANETYLIKQKPFPHLSDAELCLMYILDDDELYSQKEISQTQCMAPTTVNTIIKKWEQNGIITQVPIEGKRREKKLVLTEEGKIFVKSHLRFIYEAEEKAICKTLQKYSPEFIDALEYYGECLKAAFEEDPNI